MKEPEADQLDRLQGRHPTARRPSGRRPRHNQSHQTSASSRAGRPRLPTRFRRSRRDTDRARRQNDDHARLPGTRRVWLALAPSEPGHGVEPRHMKLLLPVVAQVLRSQLEVEHAATELAERYEEINLLYSIGEILGRTVLLEDAAATILTEISETVGARRGAILRARTHRRTYCVRWPCLAPRHRNPTDIAVDDPVSVTARVFRTQHPLIIVGQDEISRKRGANTAAGRCSPFPSCGRRPRAACRWAS